MSSLIFQHHLDNPPGLLVDAVMDNTVFEVLIELRDARRLRVALMDMAHIAAGEDKRRVVLLLEEPHITQLRLREEWAGAASVIRSELFHKLSLVYHQSGEWAGIPNPPDPRDLKVLDEIIKHGLSRQSVRSSRGSDRYYEIMRILIHQWLLGKGPVAVNWLMLTSGTSYPTVSRAIERLGHCLKRYSDRRVELRYFPRDEWAQLTALSAEVRSTTLFADRSGQPRSPESLLRRLRRIGRKDLAVGGVWGAKHYQSDLDLVGNPRLDLSLHCPAKNVDWSFVERLDPALEQTTGHDVSPDLIVHIVRRADSLFQHGEDGIPWADPVECLLDLTEARLESQAREFLNSFPAVKGQI